MATSTRASESTPSDHLNAIITKTSQEIPVTKIKEGKRKTNSGDNRAAIKKQKTVKEQKTVKDILKELPSINTRSTPGLMTDVVSSLTSEQKDWVKRMGFKAFLKINIKSIPLKLCHFVLKHYDEGTNSILIKGKRIKITKEKIHKVFGLPKTGKSLFDLDKVSEDHQVFDGWMKELEDGKANATNYKKIIQKSEQVDMNFKLGFIALFVNTFAESIPMGTNNLVPVRALVEVDDISKIDWCAYLLYCVKNSKGRWRPDNPKCYYKGPMLLLLLIYCDEIECKLQKIERKTPLVTMWTADKLKERQSFEIEAGGFGVGNLIEQSSNLEREKNENQVNENQDTRIEVVFPIHNGDQMYTVVFNLTYPQVHIIDSIQTKSLEKTYGMTPTSLKLYFIRYLEKTTFIINKIKGLRSTTVKMMKIDWNTKELTTENGALLMRHMEKYCGEKQGKWNVEMEKGSDVQDVQFVKLRALYAVKIATHEINNHKDRVIKEAIEFGKFDHATRKKMLEEGIQRMDELEMGNRI
ncbi:unnamed protein product [Lactuca saligna]|uniref:Uncharacterized protein n=1 Tax=Lactuca saligna TaxID=75948 RepID=A0AA35V812_LACSI|nr:unnamed protein product [Lactuca saligna]